MIAIQKLEWARQKSMRPFYLLHNWIKIFFNALNGICAPGRIRTLKPLAVAVLYGTHSGAFNLPCSRMSTIQNSNPPLGSKAREGLLYLCMIYFFSFIFIPPSGGLHRYYINFIVLRPLPLLTPAFYLNRLVDYYTVPLPLFHTPPY